MARFSDIYDATDPGDPNSLYPGSPGPQGGYQTQAPVNPGPLPPGYVWDPSTGRVTYGGDNGQQSAPPGVTVPPGYRYDPTSGRLIYIGGTGSNGIQNPLQSQGPTYTPTPVTPPPSSGGGPKSDPGSLGNPDLTGKFQTTLQPPAPLTGPPSYVPPTPVFNAPPIPKAPAFQLPDAVTEQNDPGYQFRLNQGEQALEQSAAGRGTLNSGGTLKDILGYGQQFASGEYQNVVNRALQQYQTNYQTQYYDPYVAAFGSAQAQFAPQMQAYATQAAAGQAQQALNSNNYFNQLGFDYNAYRNYANDEFNRLYAVTTA